MAFLKAWRTRRAGIVDGSGILQRDIAVAVLEMLKVNLEPKVNYPIGRYQDGTKFGGIVTYKFN